MSPFYGGGKADHEHVWLATVSGETCAVCGETREDETDDLSVVGICGNSGCVLSRRGGDRVCSICGMIAARYGSNTEEGCDGAYLSWPT
jgi:hypothetical protein